MRPHSPRDTLSRVVTSCPIEQILQVTRTHWDLGGLSSGLAGGLNRPTILQCETAPANPIRRIEISDQV